MGKTKRKGGIFKALYAFSMAVLVINMSFLGVFFAVPEASAQDAAPDHKIDICHYTGNGGYVVVQVDKNAWDTHTSAHSDHEMDFEAVDGECQPIDCTDSDGDGYGVGEDCLGSDCNDGNPDSWRVDYYYYDSDHDGYYKDGPNRREDGMMAICYGDTIPENYTEISNGEDCDDTDPGTNPGESEVCGDGKDNDCDGDYDCNDSDCADYCTRDCEVGDPVLIQGYADYVDLGNESSEDGHSLSGWTDEWVNPGWGGTYGGGSEDGSFRLLMGPGDGCGKGYEDASLSFDTGDGYYVDTITFEHLDGSVDDSFDVFVNDVQVGHYTGDQEEGETWVESSYSFPAVTGSVTVDFIATEPDNEWCGEWGQVAFSWVGVTGYSCESGEPECTDESEDWAQLDYVDVGDSASEYDRDLTGWSEENLPGNYGGCHRAVTVLTAR
jgi:hypothetical protein